jgi:hypothetical protein
MKISCANGIKCASVSGCDRTWGDGAIVGETMEERGHMPRCSRIIELNLHFWWLKLWRGSISNLLIAWLISNVVVDLLNRSLNFVYCDPCFDVCIGCIRIIVIAVASVIVIVIAIVIVVVVPLRQGLSFFSTSFTSAFRLDVSLLAAIVTFN